MVDPRRLAFSAGTVDPKERTSMDTILITGASRGIGRAIAIEAAGAGYAVAVNYTSSDQRASELIEELTALGAQAKAYKADVSDFDAAKALVEAVKADFGGIYGLINNAGITRDGPLLRMGEQAFDDVLATNLKGAFNMTRHASAILAKARRGRIINMASVAGLIGNAGQINYSASKAGLIGMTKATARELSARGVTCNAIAPGLIASDMTDAMPEEVREALLKKVPLGRMGEAEEVAKLCVYLLSDAAAYITGQTFAIDGGLTM